MFKKIPQDAFDQLQVDAGLLLKNFDPTDPVEPDDADIITATTGGITVNCTPSYSDWAADVDNAENNLKEFKHLDGWDCNLQTTALGTSADLIKETIGAADIDGTTKIIPRRNLKDTDFSDIWWVGNRADGGLVAVKLKNALSTSGFSLKTTKDGKGNISLTITGHISIDDLDDMPMEFYSYAGSSLLDALTVTSTAGTSEGYTAISATGHTLGSGESYAYKVGTYAEDVIFGELIVGWTAWDGEDEIEAESGKKITLVVVSSGRAVAAGSATVVASTGT